MGTRLGYLSVVRGIGLSEAPTIEALGAINAEAGKYSVVNLRPWATALVLAGRHAAAHGAY